jgi:hypothetical protein
MLRCTFIGPPDRARLRDDEGGVEATVLRCCPRPKYRCMSSDRRDRKDKPNKQASYTLPWSRSRSAFVTRTRPDFAKSCHRGVTPRVWRQLKAVGPRANLFRPAAPGPEGGVSMYVLAMLRICGTYDSSGRWFSICQPNLPSVILLSRSSCATFIGHARPTFRFYTNMPRHVPQMSSGRLSYGAILSLSRVAPIGEVGGISSVGRQGRTWTAITLG